MYRMEVAPQRAAGKAKLDLAGFRIKLSLSLAK
jgi:hypothetical protein